MKVFAFLLAAIQLTSLSSKQKTQQSWAT